MMRFSHPSKICLLILCLSQIFSATGTPQLRGATFFMKEIKLPQGKVALVDDEDFEFINQWNWGLVNVRNDLFYAVRTEWIKGGKGKSRSHRMHRVVMRITDSKILIDHRDRNGLNNQKSNLRKATKSENAQNGLSHVDSIYSKYRGVTFDKNRNKWKAHIMAGSNNINIGRFSTEIQAALAYNQKAIELHGEFANPNII